MHVKYFLTQSIQVFSSRPMRNIAMLQFTTRHQK